MDVDLSKFFDRVNHDLLMTYLGYKVKDKRLLKLIKRYLLAGTLCKTKGDNQFYSESREGVPQGRPLSPLLANIMLDPLDKELEKRGHKFARFLGLAFNARSISLICLPVTVRKSVPFRMYWRSKPLKFSFNPRSQDEYGFAK